MVAEETDVTRFLSLEGGVVVAAALDAAALVAAAASVMPTETDLTMAAVEIEMT